MKNKTARHLSPFRLALREFSRNRWAVVCAVILGLLYFLSLSADFWAPYSASMEDRNFSYCPPTMIRLRDEQGRWQRPFVYGMEAGFDQFHQRVYRRQSERKYPLKVFIKGQEYSWLGLKMNRHLFGVEEPGRIYLAGADIRGRDIFSRILHGGKISLMIGLIAVFISFSLGLLVGGIAGYYGGWVDNLLMRLCEMLMMVPGFYLLLALRAIVPPEFNSQQVYVSIIVILSFIGWGSLARIIRGMCLSLREREFVLAAKVMGLSDLNIIVRHILPHTLSYSLAAVMLAIPGYILAESFLSLVGLGIQDPYASWGNMLADVMGIIQIRVAPWILLPGLCIFVTVLCFNVVGDALRDCLDPWIKTGERT